jgi:hypothetical protein
MTTDSINDEILRIKRELAARFGNDLDLIIADAKSRERNGVSFPPRLWKSEPSDAPKPPVTAVSNGTSTPATE